MRFRGVTVRRCSNPAHLIYDVIYADGSEDRLHSGSWPMHMSRQAYAQLDAARAEFLKHEAAGTVA